jgi:fatty-acyl-CoA synthase
MKPSINDISKGQLTPQERRARIEARFPAWDVLTISAALDRAVESYSDRPLIITDAQTWSYAEVQAWSRTLASGLIARGLKSGEHVALDMANYPAFVAVKFAIARAGAVCVPVNFLLRGQELAYVLGQSDAVMLVTMDQFRGQNYLAELDQIGADVPKLRQTFIYPTGEGSPPAGNTLDALTASVTQESNAELARREAAADGSALADIIYTSGTTGRSKGVMLTHDMVLRAAFSSVIAGAFEDGRRMQFAMPMYHVFGYVECLLAVPFVGGAIVPHVVFDAAEMLDAAERHRTTELVGVPMMTQKFIEIARKRGFDSTHLLVMFNSGGANPPSIWADIRSTLGAREMRMGYGMTETSASATSSMPEEEDALLISTNGRFKPPCIAGDSALDMRVAVYKVIDPETGIDLPHDTDGELVAKGPVVTRGYYKKPEETAAAFTPDGWLRTGDVGRISADDYVTLTGRIKETYRCNGEMVMPREVELLFDDHPQIAQALVVGVPDPRAGEAGCLCIVPRNGTLPDAEALIATCAEKLARFKVPRHVVFLKAEDIPLTVTGRPQKFKLAKLAAERIAGEN